MSLRVYTPAAETRQEGTIIITAEALKHAIRDKLSTREHRSFYFDPVIQADNAYYFKFSDRGVFNVTCEARRISCLTIARYAPPSVGIVIDKSVNDLCKVIVNLYQRSISCDEHVRAHHIDELIIPYKWQEELGIKIEAKSIGKIYCSGPIPNFHRLNLCYYIACKDIISANFKLEPREKRIMCENYLNIEKKRSIATAMGCLFMLVHERATLKLD